ncbi:MAG: DUF3084 domain-containing protein [Synergistales bacterium]|nr:DUF3084 domain-containing protein [Synergistales bacterium]
MSVLAEVNWTLIFILILISAAVAYVGDFLGMRIGRRRISLFGMRPKHTTSFVTVVTGVLITLVTLSVLASTSETVRTALFKLRMVQRQIDQLSYQLDESRERLSEMEGRLNESLEELAAKRTELRQVEERLAAKEQELEELRAQNQEVRSQARLAEARRSVLEEELDRLAKVRESLQESITALQRGLEQVREGRIVAMAGEVLAQIVVTPQESYAPDALMQALTQRASYAVAQRIQAAPEETEIQPVPGTEEALEQALDKAGEQRMVLRFVAAGNAVYKEEVVCGLAAFESKRIYPDGVVLAEERMPGGLAQPEAERRLHMLLRRVNKKATDDGILRDPLRGTVGNLGAVEFFDAVDRIADAGTPVHVRVVTTDDIYTEGPVRISIEIDGIPRETDKGV